MIFTDKNMLKVKAMAILRLALILSLSPNFALPVSSQVAFKTTNITKQNFNCPSQRRLLLKDSNGLLYPSESDYPFEYFHNGQVFSLPSAQQFIRLIGQQTQPVTQVGFDEFFNKLIGNLRTSGAEKETIRRYQLLRKAFKNKFTNLTVYRVGQIQVQVYIVGVNSTCGMAGLKTISIET